MRADLRQGRGFTLIEILIVMAVLAVLAAVVVPNVAGFLGRGKERAFESDRRILQSAVDAWRSDIGSRSGNPWPTVGGVKGTPTDGGTPDGDFVDAADTNSIIKLSDLAPTYLKDLATVKSFKYATAVTGATGATNTPVGSYYWYINTDGIVTGWYDADDDKVVDSGEAAFSDNVYP